MWTNTSVRLCFYVTFAITVVVWYVSLQMNRETMRKIVPKINENERANGAKQKLLSNFTAMSNLIGADRLPVTLYRTYRLEIPSLCSSESSVLILVGVKSSPTNFDYRKIQRETWMNQIATLMFEKVKFLFIIGKTDSSTQKQIEDEFNRYGDILQGDFIDTYRNLTEKGVTFLKWATERCRNAKMILLTDDDVIVNVFNLFKYFIPIMHNQSKTIICIELTSSPVLRSKDSKWFIERKLFPNTSVYPPYCTGFFVMYTNDLTPLFYEAAKSTPLFWIEDVYLYGLLVHRVPGVTLRSMKRNTFVLGKKKAHSCFYYDNGQIKACKDLIVAGNIDIGNLRDVWSEIVKRNLLETPLNIIL